MEFRKLHQWKMHVRPQILRRLDLLNALSLIKTVLIQATSETHLTVFFSASNPSQGLPNALWLISNFLVLYAQGTDFPFPYKQTQPSVVFQTFLPYLPVLIQPAPPTYLNVSLFGLNKGITERLTSTLTCLLQLELVPLPVATLHHPYSHPHWANQDTLVSYHCLMSLK